MAIAFDATDPGSQGAGSTTHSWSHTCTGSNLMLIVSAISDNNVDSITGVTYNSVALTKLASAQISGARYVYLWYLIAPATGANTVVVTSSGTEYSGGRSISYTGVKQTGFPDSQSTATSTGVNITGTTTVVATDCWTVMVNVHDGGGWAPPTAGSGTTGRQLDSIAGICDSNGTVATGARSLILDGGSGSGGNACVIASFAPAVAAGPTTVKTWDGLALASVKTVDGLAIASVKSINGNT